MTYGNHHKMVNLKKQSEIDNRQDTLSAVMLLKESTSSEIHLHICSERKNFNKKINIGYGYNGVETSHDKTKSPISLRTVQRHLNALAQEGLVKRRENLYRLTKQGKSDARYFGKQFGSIIMNRIINQPEFKLRSVKENLRDLVTIFGSYVVLCCLEAVKPSKRSIRSATAKDNKCYEYLESKMTWINSAIRPTSMLHYFLFTFLNQQDTELGKNFRQVKFTRTEGSKYVHVDEESGKEYKLDTRSPTHYMYVDKQGKTKEPEFYRDIPYVDNCLLLDKYSSVYTDYNTIPFDQVSPELYKNLVDEFQNEYQEIWKKCNAN